MADTFDKGINETADRGDLQDGEMRSMAGLVYKPNDKRAHLVNPSTAFSAAASSVQDLEMLPFDNGPDTLLARAGDSIYAEDVAAASPSLGTANLSPSLTGLSGDRMVAAHYEDKWFMSLGAGQKPQVVKSSGSLPLTSRRWGLAAPVEALTFTTSAGAATLYHPQAVDTNNNWTDPTDAYDADDDTFAYSTIDAFDGEGTPPLNTLDLGDWQANAGPGNVLYVRWSFETETENGNVVLQLQYREEGTTVGQWDNVYIGALQASQGQTVSQVAITGNASFVELRAVLSHITGASGEAGTVKIHETWVSSGSGESNFTLSASLLYAAVESIDNEDIAGPRGPELEVTVAGFGTSNAVLLAIPTAVNSAATHWKIYRSAEGGTVNTLGLIGTIGIAQTSFTDDFSTWASTVQPDTAYPQLRSGGLFFDRDVPPPPLQYAWSHKGRMLAIDSANPRRLLASIPGRPESFPTIYSTPAPQPEHDTLLAGAEIGQVSIVATSGGISRLYDPPTIQNNVLIDGRIDRISGAPGCVGYNAFTVVPFGGVSHVAWVSPTQGVCLTNGHNWRRISDDIDWSKFKDVDMSNFVLHWDENRRVLVFAYDTAGGDNDSYYLGHVEREKVGGIAWTGPTSDAYVVRLASGRTSTGSQRIYGANDDTVKRLDDSSGVDSVSFSMQTGRRYGPNWRSYAVHDGGLRHTDFGSGATGSLAYTVGRDSSDRSHTKTVSVALASEKRTQFDISRSGEWHEYLLSGSGAAGGAFVHIDWRGDLQGKEGKVGA